VKDRIIEFENISEGYAFIQITIIKKTVILFHVVDFNNYEGGDKQKPKAL